MLNVMLSVKIKFIMLSVIMLNVMAPRSVWAYAEIMKHFDWFQYGPLY